MVDQNKLKNYLQAIGSNGLPGLKAHIELTPYRKDVLPPKQKIPKQGAVAVILSFYSSSPSIILTRRASYAGVHGGQISFPGGKNDESDLDLHYTSIRETREEIGIALDHSHYLGQLSQIYIPPSNFLVHPFLFFTNNKCIGIENNEVEYILEFPVNELIKDSAITNKEILLSDGRKIQNAPCFIYKDEIIWGATAAILNELRWLLKAI